MHRLDGFRDAVAHGVEIGIGAGHLGKDVLQPALERGRGFVGAERIDGELDEADAIGPAGAVIEAAIGPARGGEALERAFGTASDVEDRVGDVVDAERRLGDLGSDGIEQESHVVADDADQVLGLAAGTEAVRLVDPDDAQAGPLGLKGGKPGTGRGRERRRLEGGQILGRWAREQQRRQHRLGSTFADRRLDGRNDRCLRRVLVPHAVSFP